MNKPKESNQSNLIKHHEHSEIRAYRVFEDIEPGWDHDLHVHSNWSQDNLNGPSHGDFLQLAQRYKIHVGFADHYEIGFYTRKPPKSADLGPWKLNPTTIDDYLEHCDRVKEDYKNVSIGLEVSYHAEIASEIDTFLDDYYSQFDYMIGSLHEVDLFKAVTISRDLTETIQKYGSLQKVAKLYFQALEDMISTKRFDIIGHPDVLFRFSHLSSLSTELKSFYTQRMLDIAWLCQKSKTLMEINLSGYRFAWKDSFPPQFILSHLQSSEIPMVIGSDSHLLDHFVAAVPRIREFNRLIRNEWKFVHKFSLE